MPTAIGYQNYALTGGITASSQSTALPASNLSGDLCTPSLGWETALSGLSAVALRITASATGVPWRLFGLFRTNLTAAATISVAVWRSIGGTPTLVWQSATSSGPVPNYGQVVFVAPSAQVGDYAVFTINDPTNPESVINVAGVYAGPGWFPLSGITWQSSYGREQNTRQTQTRGGQEYRRMRWQRRVWQIGFDGIREAELWSDVDSLRMTAPRGSNVLFMPNTASAYLKQETTFGMLSETANVEFPARSADRRSWRATISERL